MFQILAADPVTPFVFGFPIAYPKFGVDTVLSSVIPKYNGGDIDSAITVLNNIPEIKNSIKTKLALINLHFFILNFIPFSLRLKVHIVLKDFYSLST